MADYITYFNGEWIPFSQVKIDPMDRGFLVGDVVFDVARTFNGKSFRLQAHIDRLYRSLKFIRIDPGLSPEEMFAISEEVVARNEHLREAVGDFTATQVAEAIRLVRDVLVASRLDHRMIVSHDPAITYQLPKAVSLAELNRAST